MIQHWEKWFSRSNSTYLKSSSFNMKLNNSMFACKWIDNSKDQSMEVEMFHKANGFIFPSFWYTTKGEVCTILHHIKELIDISTHVVKCCNLKIQLAPKSAPKYYFNYY